MQGEEGAKVRETSLASVMFRHGGVNDPERWLSIRYNFGARIPENERQQTGKLRRRDQRRDRGRAGPETFAMRVMRLQGSRADPGKDPQRFGRRFDFSALALREVQFGKDRAAAYSASARAFLS
jgi:hypothetical protein